MASKVRQRAATPVTVTPESSPRSKPIEEF
jgi:hypothetical protein